MKNREVSNFIMSMLPLLVLIISTLVLVGMFHIPILFTLGLSAIIAGIVAKFWFKFSYEEIMEGASSSVGKIVPAILILFCVGILSSVFMYAGIVPSLMYYSSQFIAPQIFLPAVMIITAIISIAIGSSFTSIATIGLAFFSAGVALGYNEGLLLGAIISGAMFGDKMSPLSDTTNISSMMAETSLFKHIKNMFLDSIIAFSITLVLFFILGLNYNVSDAALGTAELQAAITSTFTVNPLLAITPLILIVFIYFKIPVLPSILLTVVVSFIIAVVVQGFGFLEVANGIVTSTSIINEDSPAVAQEFTSLFNKGGMETMLATVATAMLATILGGILRYTGMFTHIFKPLNNAVTTPKKAIYSTLLASITVAVSSGEQYISIMLPIDIFKDKFKQLNIREEHLSRAAESGGTVVSAIVPWGVFAPFIFANFNLTPFEYIPYTFFCFIMPITTVIVVSLTKNKKLVKEDEIETVRSSKVVEQA